LIKEKLEQSASADEINPISQLIQIQQARKEKEPTYTVVDERGTARRREFIIEVSVSGFSATGTGPNKKIAKRIAAENLLVAMGIGKPASTITMSQSETPGKEKKIDDRNKKVSFNEAEAKKPAKSHISGSSGRQIVPGLLLVSSNETFSTPTKPASTTTTLAPKEDSHSQASEKSLSPNSNASNNDSGIGENGVNPRDQLNYLAQLIGFSVSYSDFPKANHTEFLSLVTLSTDPPHMGHGSGTTIDESRDSAALKALSVISDIGLDNVKPKGPK
jgi:double-stranded RNA-binding protein Staufen